MVYRYTLLFYHIGKITIFRGKSSTHETFCNIWRTELCHIPGSGKEFQPAFEVELLGNERDVACLGDTLIVSVFLEPSAWILDTSCPSKKATFQQNSPELGHHRIS
jgi:hypothetical protein